MSDEKPLTTLKVVRMELPERRTTSRFKDEHYPAMTVLKPRLR